MESVSKTAAPVNPKRYSKAYQQQVEIKKRQLDQLIRQINGLEILKQQKMTQYQLLYEEIIRKKQKLRTVSTVQVEIDRLNFLLEMSKKSVALITPKELEEIMKYNNPPERIKLALEAVMYLLHGKKMDWDSIKREMSSGAFISGIIKFNPRNPNTNVINNLQRDYVQAEWFDIAKIRAASQAVGPLADWLVSQINFIKSLGKLTPVMQELKDLKNERLSLEDKELELNEEITNIETMIDIAQIQRQNLEEEIKSFEKGVDPENTLVSRISQYMQQSRRDSRAIRNSRRSSFFPQLEEPIHEEDSSFDNETDIELLTSQHESISGQRKRTFDVQNINVIVHQKTSNPPKVAKADKHVHFDGLGSQVSDKISSEKLIHVDLRINEHHNISPGHLESEGEMITKDSRIQRETSSQNNLRNSTDEQELKIRNRVDSTSQEHRKTDPLHVDNDENSNNTLLLKTSRAEEFAEFDRKLLENSKALWDQDQIELFHPLGYESLENVGNFNTFNANSVEDEVPGFNIREIHEINATGLNPFELNRATSKNMKKQSSKSELNIKLHHTDANLDNTLSLTDISIRGDNPKDQMLKDTREIGVQVKPQGLHDSDSFAQFEAQLQENNNGRASYRSRNRSGSEHLTQYTGLKSSLGISNLIKVPKEVVSTINSNVSSNLTKPAKQNDFHVSMVSFIDKMKSEPSIYSDPQELIQRIDEQIRRFSEHINQEEQLKALNQILQKNQEEGLDVVPERNEENSLQQNESSTTDPMNRLNTFERGSSNSIGLLSAKNQVLNVNDSQLYVGQSGSFQTFQRENGSIMGEGAQPEGLFSKKRSDKETLTSGKFIPVSQDYPALTINPPINYLNQGSRNEGGHLNHNQGSKNVSLVQSEHDKNRPIQLDLTTHLTIHHYHISESQLNQVNSLRIPRSSHQDQTLTSINSSMNGLTQSLVQTNKRAYASRQIQSPSQLPLLYHTQQTGGQLSYQKHIGMPLRPESHSPNSYMPVTIRTSYTRPSKAQTEFPNQGEAISPQQIIKTDLGTRSLSPLPRSAQNSFANRYEPLNMSMSDKRDSPINAIQSFKSFNDRPVSSDIKAAENRLTLVQGKEQHQKILKTFNVNGRELYLVRIDDNVNIYRYKEDLDK